MPEPHPFVELPARAQRSETSVDVTRLLVERFGLTSFRPWQREAIDALLAPPGRVMIVAPTGGGKSLCYQLPALALEGTTLVLCPLISLMEDQVRALESKGIPATFLASSLGREESMRRMNGLRRGAYKIVYAAPERLAFDGFIEALGQCHLAMIAIDEAHCIVQWGHDFRPDYLRIGEALERLRPPRLLACTATATADAREEILRQLGSYRDGVKVILRGFARPNLHLAARECAKKAEAKREVVGAVRRSLAKAGGSAIVYAATRKNTVEMAEELCEAGIEAEAYHAGLDASVRARVSEQFADGRLHVVVATNAFGMGIDRADVRVVVHMQPPGSIEAYYQEVGRAGRDGDPADGLLLMTPADIALRKRMTESSADGSPAPASDVARAWGLFREVLHYVDAGTCRHDFILRYFGDEAESLGGCGHCDVCMGIVSATELDPEAIERDADVVRRALAGVARVKGRAGLLAIGAMLRGEAGGRFAKYGLDSLSTFGILRDHGEQELSSVFRVLLAAGWIDLSGSEYPVPMVTDAGWRVMTGEAPCRVCLPKPRARSPKRASTGAAERPKSKRGASATPSEAGTLLEALKAHRVAVAKERGVSAFIVASNRSLEDIAERRPTSTDELEEAYGMGPARVASYGEGILAVIRAYGE